MCHLWQASAHRITGRSAHIQVQGPALKVTAVSAVTRLLFGLLAESLHHSQERSLFLPQVEGCNQGPHLENWLGFTWQISQPCCFLKGITNRPPECLSSALTRRKWDFCHAEGHCRTPPLPVKGARDLCQCHPVGERQQFWRGQWHWHRCSSRFCSEPQPCSAVSRAQLRLPFALLCFAWQFDKGALQITPGKDFNAGGKWSCGKVLIFWIGVILPKSLCGLTFLEIEFPYLVASYFPFHRCSLVHWEAQVPWGLLVSFPLSSRPDTEAGRYSRA